MIARSTASTRLSGQPRVSAVSICGSSRALLAHHTADDVAKKCRFGGAVLRAFYLAAEPMISNSAMISLRPEPAISI